jgi:hypothetical protein
LCTLISSPKVSGYTGVAKLSSDNEKCSFPSLAHSSGSYTFAHVMRWSSSVFQPEVFPQDHIRHFFE